MTPTKGAETREAFAVVTPVVMSRGYPKLPEACWRESLAGLEPELPARDLAEEPVRDVDPEDRVLLLPAQRHH